MDVSLNISLLTKLRKDKAAPKFTIVGMMENFPACKNPKQSAKWKRRYILIKLLLLQDLFKPHSSKHNDIEVDPVGFD